MAVSDIVAKRSDEYLQRLTEACSIPSMASDPKGLADMAGWLHERFVELGAKVDRLTQDGAPDALLAEIGSGDRTVLIYDHYDVQPVDPLDLWRSQPFSPEVRDGFLYARGVADNKGDLVARLCGIHALLESEGDVPVKIKFLVEGEEETGSKSFGSMIERYGDRLSADGCIWEGEGVDHKGRPSFVFGAKGLAYVELTYRGLKDDQHSSLAVVAPSPVWHLVEALSTLRSPDGRVLIDGFYDDVVESTEDDLRMLDTLPFEEEAEKERLGIEDFVGGVSGKDFLRRYFFEPTCNIAGIVSGFTVPRASKTVLPAEAMAKIDMRLVPNQDPDDIVEKLRTHLERRGFGDIELLRHSMERPVRSPADSAIGRAAVEAARDVYDASPVLSPMMIGTGPMHHIADTLGIPTVSPAGVARPDSNIHAPNEKTGVGDFLRTVEYTGAWMKRFAEI